MPRTKNMKLLMHSHSSITHRSPRVEITQVFSTHGASLSLKRREAPILATTWKDLETTMLSERSRHRRTHCGIPWMGNIQIRHNHRDREWVPGCQGLGEGMRGDC